MSCLLPQFKCLPDSFSIGFKSLNHHSPNHSPPVSTESIVLNLEKLKLSSVEVHSNSGTVDRQWSSSSSSSTSTTAGVLGIEKLQVNTGTTLPSEFASTEYAEAIALARAAVKAAKSAATMMMNHQSLKPLNIKEKPKLPESDISINEPGTEPSEEVEPTIEEHQLLEEELSASISVRSTRQAERKERRTRAAERAEAGVVSKSASTGRARAAPSTVPVKSGVSRRRGGKKVKSGVSRRRGEKKDVLAFLGEMRNAKLLTAAEEVELSKGMQDLLKLQEVHTALETRFGEPPTFAEWASAAGIDRIQLGRRLHYGKQCRENMIRSNIRLVISVARRYCGTKVHLQDIVQDGIRGLIKSAEQFDTSKGLKFSTGAYLRIRDAVLRSRAEQSRIIRVSYHMVRVQSKVIEAKYRLAEQLRRKPTRAEIAVETGLSIKRIQSAEQAPKPARSIDIPVWLGNNTKLTDLLDDPDQETPEAILIKQTMSMDLRKVLNTLGEKEQKVIRWRFGLEDGKTRTLQEIGDVMGVSSVRVRQIEQRALRKLRNSTLRQYFPQ